MTRYRTEDDGDSNGSVLAAAAVGALLGLAAGVLIAQKMGGWSGLRARLGERLGRAAAGDLRDSALDRLRETAGDAFDDEDGSLSDESDDDYDDEYDDGNVGSGDGSFDDFDDDELEADVEREAAEAALEDRVLAAFLADPVFRERAVDVGAADGTVIELAGWVHSDAERERASVVARRVPGVSAVVNELLVGDPDTLDAEDLATRT